MKIWTPALRTAAVIIQQIYNLKHPLKLDETLAEIENLKRKHKKQTLDDIDERIFHKLQSIGINLTN